MNKSIMWYQPANLHDPDVILIDGEIAEDGEARQKCFDEYSEFAKAVVDKSRPWCGRIGDCFYIKGSLNQVDQKGRLLSFDFVSKYDCWKDQYKQCINTIGIVPTRETDASLKTHDTKRMVLYAFAIIVAILATLIMINKYTNFS